MGKHNIIESFNIDYRMYQPGTGAGTEAECTIITKTMITRDNDYHLMNDHNKTNAIMDGHCHDL